MFDCGPIRKPGKASNRQTDPGWLQWFWQAWSDLDGNAPALVVLVSEGLPGLAARSFTYLVVESFPRFPYLLCGVRR